MSSSCTCRNHMGTEKIQHRTKQKALDAAIEQAMKGRPASIYPCPKSDRWHVRTESPFRRRDVDPLTYVRSETA